MGVEFDPASSEYIDFASPAALDNIWASGGSIAFWVYIDTLAAQVGLCGKATSTATGGDGWGVVVGTAGSISLRHAWSTNRGIWSAPAATMTTGLWYHITITYDKSGAAPGSDPLIYINGVSQSITENQTPAGTVADDAALSMALGFGYSQAVQTFHDGQIEDFRAYTRVLTLEEVSVLAAGYRGPLGGEVGWWTLQDAQVVQHWDGDSLATTDVIPDMSGNGNDGTPTNTPTARASEAPRFGAVLG
jgi:hypothetical protein